MARPRSPITGHHTLEVRERQDRALHLRRQGLDYPAIARQVGYKTGQSARNAVLAALDRQPAEDAPVVRHIELERLDWLWQKAARQVDLDHVMVSQGQVVQGVVDEAGKLAAIDRCLKIMDRRARYLGLDAPTRSRVEVVTEDVVDAEIRRLEAELAAGGSPGRETGAAEGTAPTGS